MKKNSLRILLAIYCSLFLLAGNLNYSSMYGSCGSIDGMESECGMECCETSCCTVNFKGVIITAKKVCCEILPSNETDQLFQTIAVNKDPDKPKGVSLNFLFPQANNIQSNLLKSSPPGKFLPTYLEFQNLRI